MKQGGGKVKEGRQGPGGTQMGRDGVWQAALALCASFHIGWKDLSGAAKSP